MCTFLMLRATSSYASQCTANITNYWTLDASVGGTFVDLASGVDASCNSPECPTASAAMIGNGFSFDGINDSVNVSPHSTFNWGNTDSFSIELWMKPGYNGTPASTQVVIGRFDVSAQLQWWVGIGTSGKVRFFLRDKSGTLFSLTGTKVLGNGWQHVVAVRDANASAIRLYVNGVQDAANTAAVYSSGFDSATVPLNIGNMAGGYPFQGLVDEVALYNRALTNAEIRSHYYLARGYCDQCTNPVKIMPLGDSNTVGAGTGGNAVAYMTGYRQPLSLSLTGSGYITDLVGSVETGQLAVPGFDYQHEGHGGFTSTQVAGQVYSWLVNNPADVVLLHIGTNDVTYSSSYIANILDEIDRFSEKTTVILARIINEQPYKASVTQFNDSVQTMAQARIDNGDKIIIVNQESALNYTSDMSDSIHPNQSGYDKMAGVWLSSLTSFLPADALPVCGNLAPIITSQPVMTGSVGILYQYDVNASGIPAPNYSLVTNPSGMTIDANTGLIQWTPSSAGLFNVTVEALSLTGTNTQNFTVNVASGTGGTSYSVWTPGATVGPEGSSGAFELGVKFRADTNGY
ncbi:MAG TPA: LamG-like jellyroll fold domain-containing protein, partial [Nitrospirota bacterium]|nr:LamG-like jellyroll fold domain-containing protein [Nitrospirota bacterium]